MIQQQTQREELALDSTTLQQLAGVLAGSAVETGMTMTSQPMTSVANAHLLAEICFKSLSPRHLNVLRKTVGHKQINLTCLNFVQGSTTWINACLIQTL
jgi:hypothetical protein